MKRIIAVLLICLLLVPAIASAVPGMAKGHEKEKGGLPAQAGQVQKNGIGEDQSRGRNVTELHAAIQERKEERERERVEAQNARRQYLGNQNQYLGNQNRVRFAVHTLLAAENRTGGIGPEISAIAREFNNSIDKATQAEERIMNRNRLTRMFFGGDAAAAEQIEEMIIRNQERIQELKRLIEDCPCDDETRALLMEQVRAMEEEQERLRELVRQELEDRGLLGRLWKRSPAGG
ncbi:MAG: hypothetical protein KO206_04775 [Methanomicrobiaceae archaeon]|nr:hypothetical protein [Methanomicrobiaceae archaeon]